MGSLIAIAVLLLLLGLLTYPGEWTHVSTTASRWLYDRGARGYQRKWQSKYYAGCAAGDDIARHVTSGVKLSGIAQVLDLGCGTGRGTRLVMDTLPADTQFTLIDFSPGMLAQFRDWLATRDKALVERVRVVESELGTWAQQTTAERYGATLLLEVGEFIPGFAQVIQQIGRVTAAGGTLAMTRPAGAWAYFFPGRGQSRRAIAQALTDAGFATPDFVPWRSRYELVFSRKLSRENGHCQQ